MRSYLRGSALPTVIAVSTVMLTALLGLVALWEQETLQFVRLQRRAQAQAYIASAATLYRLHPDDEALTAIEGYLFCDTLPQSRVFLHRELWGLYELLHIATADSLAVSSRLMGTEPDAARTLYYPDRRTAVTLAGKTELQGELHLPRNGVVYGRMGADFFRGQKIPRIAIRSSENGMPALDAAVLYRIDSIFASGEYLPSSEAVDSLTVSFRCDKTVALKIGNTEICDCTLRGRIVLHAEDLRIDSACCMEHVIVVARKITVGSGASVTAQLFASDTIIMEPRAVLEYPSGIWSGGYAELQAQTEVNGYVVVQNITKCSEPQPCYRQAHTARLHGVLRADGAVEVQGIVAGCAILQQAVYISPQGYYRDMLYDCTLLENPVTAQPLGLGVGTKRRKEAIWVE